MYWGLPTTLVSARTHVSAECLPGRSPQFGHEQAATPRLTHSGGADTVPSGIVVAVGAKGTAAHFPVSGRGWIMFLLMDTIDALARVRTIRPATAAVGAVIDYLSQAAASSNSMLKYRKPFCSPTLWMVTTLESLNRARVAASVRNWRCVRDRPLLIRDELDSDISAQFFLNSLVDYGPCRPCRAFAGM